MIVKEMWALQPQDNRELMQSRALIKYCCAMRIDLISSATVVDRAVKFVDRNKGLIPLNKKVTMDDTTESVQILDKYEHEQQQLCSSSTQQFELLKGLPFYNFQNPKNFWTLSECR